MGSHGPKNITAELKLALPCPIRTTYLMGARGEPFRGTAGKGLFNSFAVDGGGGCGYPHLGPSRLGAVMWRGDPDQETASPFSFSSSQPTMV